jgi:hypothetical protein
MIKFPIDEDHPFLSGVIAGLVFLAVKELLLLFFT